MKKLIVLGMLLVPSLSLAQYSGPAVNTCLAYAKQEAVRDGTRAKDIIFERDQELVIERYTRKLGSQFVSSVLKGNGAVVLEGAPSAELSFICLLANDKQAVFFDWLPRAHSSAIAQCTRDDGMRGKPRPCLELMQRIVENDLTQAYAEQFQTARERDSKSGNEAAIGAFRKANEEWLQYRDAECARRRDHAPKGISPEDHQLACVIDLTRRRAVDLR